MCHIGTQVGLLQFVVNTQEANKQPSMHNSHFVWGVVSGHHSKEGSPYTWTFPEHIGGRNPITGNHAGTEISVERETQMGKPKKKPVKPKPNVQHIATLACTHLCDKALSTKVEHCCIWLSNVQWTLNWQDMQKNWNMMHNAHYTSNCHDTTALSKSANRSQWFLAIKPLDM